MKAFRVWITSVVNTEDPSDSSHAFVALGCVRQLSAHWFEDHKITPVGTDWLSAPLGTAAVVSLSSALHSRVYAGFQTAMLNLGSCFFNEINGLSPRLHGLNSDTELDLCTTAASGLLRQGRYHVPGQVVCKLRTCCPGYLALEEAFRESQVGPGCAFWKWPKAFPSSSSIPHNSKQPFIPKALSTQPFKNMKHNEGEPNHKESWTPWRKEGSVSVAESQDDSQWYDV